MKPVTQRKLWTPEGNEWGLHAVVMDHGSLAWDPHPEAEDRGEDDQLFFHDALTFRVLDPSVLKPA